MAAAGADCNKPYDAGSEVLSGKNLDKQYNGPVLAVTFFDRSAETVAHDLIGQLLCWRKGDQTHSGIITEVEAYVGPEDLASHASNGRRTNRNEPMFGPPGIFYVYFVYGMHWMLNVVSGPIDYPAGVLIRGLEGLVGPGRVTKALGINGDLNGTPAIPSSGVWFSRGPKGKREIFALPASVSLMRVKTGHRDHSVLF